MSMSLIAKLGFGAGVLALTGSLIYGSIPQNMKSEIYANLNDPIVRSQLDVPGQVDYSIEEIVDRLQDAGEKLAYKIKGDY